MRSKQKPHQYRYETALCGRDIYGVYDNKIKRFVITDITKAEADKISSDQAGLELDRMLVRLARQAGLL